MDDCDICVIGGGPAGYAAAIRAWDFGAKVCLVEKSSLGGAGIFNGVMMSKALWELSCDFRDAQRTDRGYTFQNVEVDYLRVQEEARCGMTEKVAQMRRQLAVLSEPDPGCTGSIRLLEGTAKFLDSHTIEVSGGSAEPKKLSAKYFVIATGSRPRELDGIPVDGRLILTSEHLDELPGFPRSIVIVGAGVIGCEFATVLANFGKTKVYLIDRAPRILPFEDEDIAAVCARNLEAKGVTIHHAAKLITLETRGDHVSYTIEHANGGRETIKVECALISVGRVPNSNGLGLEKAGVELDEQGYIKDDNARTNVPHIYAAGDVTRLDALVNVGEIEGRHAIERIFNATTRPLTCDYLPTIMFLDPEVAAIGLNESQAETKRISYAVAVYGYRLVNRAIVMRRTDGFVKVLASNDEQMKILGMRAVGVHASSAIQAIALAVKLGISAREFSELIHPHPAVTEAVQECVRMLSGTSIYKAEVFSENLRLSRVNFA